MVQELPLKEIIIYSNDELWEKKQKYVERFWDQGVLVYLYDHNLYNFRENKD